MNPVSENTSIALVMLAAALWATTGIVAELVPPSVQLSPEVLGMMRNAIGGMVLLVAALFVLGPREIGVARINSVNLMLFVVSNSVFQVSLFSAFSSLGVAVTMFLSVCLRPVIAMGWTWLRGGERATRGSILALAHATLGLLLISIAPTGGAGVPMSANGIALALTTAIAFVTMSQAARTLSQSTPPLLVAGVGISLSGVVLFAVVWIFSFSSLSTMVEGLSNPVTLGLVLYLGLGPTALAFVAYCVGIAGCRSALVALIAAMIQPAIATVLAVWILSETPSVKEAAGCLLLMIAMLILWQSERRLARQRTSSRVVAAAE